MTTTIEVHRPGLWSWVTLIKCEAKMVVRDTAGLVVPIGLPLLILIMSASAASAQAAGDTGLTGLEVYVLPLVFAVVIASIGIINMPSFLSYYRRSGILRRLAVTPASPVMVLVAQAVVSLMQAALGVGVALAVAVLFFGAQFPVAPLTAIGVALLGLGAMYGVGMIVAAVAPTPNSAVAIGLIAFFAVGSLGGLFGAQALPDSLARVGELLPFGATVQAMGDAWVGTAVDPAHIVSLVATIIVGGVVSAAFFRWD
ncbi:ABC transporter permease [Hoyosella rhizosphaerae]|uniref:Transport permease protein n=1 Tax=Hoyosella rhizosphaerae TaxID=1755582 RepID=A0A916U0W0_9ACTN|nr:ABC transporter permease [Hoyosella rhizosphaerae]MBN4927134.1 ABC transporter permease [Hoyosella rhizosphaerae]GGC53715.1 transport permease protein [Hoyosella rhizosphaerae]